MNNDHRLLLKDRVKSILLERIRAVEPGGTAYLPSERALSQELEVSRGPVQAALSELEAEGLIQREHGRGSRIISDLPAASFNVAVIYPHRLNPSPKRGLGALGPR